MTRDSITIQKPVIDATDSVGIKKITAQAVTVANGIELTEAMECMNNTLFVVVTNTYSTADCTITFKKGDKFPNTMLGDLTLVAEKSATSIYQIQDPARFINNDGSILIDFSANFAGTIYAIGKKVGL